MKKKIYKAFRHARRKVAQYIVGFDRCPVSYRKNYCLIIKNGLKGIFLGLVCTGILMLLFLLA